MPRKKQQVAKPTNGKKNGSDKKRKAEDLVMLIKKSTIKEFVHDKGLSCSAEVMVNLNLEVHRLIRKAMNRAQDNRRATVQSKDI